MVFGIGFEMFCFLVYTGIFVPAYIISEGVISPLVFYMTPFILYMLKFFIALLFVNFIYLKKE